MNSIDEPKRQQIVERVLTARQRRHEFLAQMKHRQQRGWRVAKKCGQILKEKFGVERVVLFGSLLDYQRLTWHSDIDLAV